MKGRVKSSNVITIAEKQCCEIHIYEVNLPRATKPAHELSFDMSVTEIQLF